MNGTTKQYTNGVSNGVAEANVAQLKAAVAGEKSGLAKIEVPDDNPFVLFREWHSDAHASSLVLPNALCLATASKDGKVSARHLLLRRLEDDGFVIMTDRRSRKSAELVENPRASMVFLWCYKRADGLTVNRQVRIEGEVSELGPDQWGDVYDREPLFCKVRAHVCHQGRPVEWEDLKSRHDELVKTVVEESKPASLARPDHVVLYKMNPTMIEFYYAYDAHIGDRIMFLKKSAEKWEHHRIAA